MVYIIEDAIEITMSNNKIIVDVIYLRAIRKNEIIKIKFVVIF